MTGVDASTTLAVDVVAHSESRGSESLTLDEQGVPDTLPVVAGPAGSASQELRHDWIGSTLVPS